MEFVTARLDSYVFPELTPQGLSGTVDAVVNSTYTGSGTLNLPEVEDAPTHATIALTSTGTTIVIDEHSDWPPEEDPITSVLGNGVYFFKVISVFGRKRWYLMELGAATPGGSAGGNTTEEIEVFNVNIGGYSDDDIIPAGTALEDIIKRMLSVFIPANYTAPVISITGVNNQNAEVGEDVVLSFSVDFVQNDAGAIIGWTLYEEGIQVHTNPTVDIYNTTVTAPDGNLDYIASVTYGEGPIKNDNLGNPSPAGQILAGTASSPTVLVRGKRKLFYGIDGNESDSRALGNDILNPSNGEVITVTDVTGGNFILSYPATLNDVTALSMESGGFTFDILSEFTQLPDEMVAGANGASPIPYKVYKYEPVAPFSNVDITATL